MKRAGFTLIEVLIIIVVIAILAAIIIPRILGAVREAREATLKAQLQEMRNALVRFEKECGCSPDELQDIMAVKAPKVGAKGAKIDPDKYKGPYLTTADGELPWNPINGSNAVGVPGRTGDDVVGWIYDHSTGQVHAQAGLAVDGTDYGDW
jgi:general secretion pathway protein G